jgi:hypothetical protein
MHCERGIASAREVKRVSEKNFEVKMESSMFDGWKRGKGYD